MWEKVSSENTNFCNIPKTASFYFKAFLIDNTLGAETFPGRKFLEKRTRNGGHKLSRMTFFSSNFATKTFAIEKKVHVHVKKVSRLKKSEGKL